MLPSAFAFAETNDSSVVACLDLSARAHAVLSVAASLARSLRLPLTVFHVIESQPGGARYDPLDWNLGRLQARRNLERLGNTLKMPSDGLAYEIAEGDRVEEIARKGTAPGTTLVLGTCCERANSRRGQTAQQVLESGVGRVILVPSAQSDDALQTILVPLDGSGYCETALVEASLLAERTGADLLLVHVVPQNGLIFFGPLDATDLRLRDELDRRNENSACGFLERTRRRLADRGLKVRSLCVKGDPRTELAHVIAAERPGLVIISTRGQGGRHCGDLSIGSTASYLLAHADGPVMVLRPTAASAQRFPKSVPEPRLPSSPLAA